jgi:hypothetical protein
MMSDTIQEIRRILIEASKEERLRIFQQLRGEFPIHSLEKEWNASAELILEAISRASDLTKRGIRGVIAEAAFDQYVVQHLRDRDWKSETPAGDHPFDFLLVDTVGPVKVQVKMQRLEKKVPKLWTPTSPFFVVETQKTRSGTDNSGKSTRPYRFGEFDVLAVSMHPSCNDWSRFRFTVASWLWARPEDERLIRVYQPVSDTANADWCDDLQTAVAWFREQIKKTIYEPPKPSRKKRIE